MRSRNARRTNVSSEQSLAGAIFRARRRSETAASIARADDRAPARGASAGLLRSLDLHVVIDAEPFLRRLAAAEPVDGQSIDLRRGPEPEVEARVARGEVRAAAHGVADEVLPAGVHLDAQRA